MNAVLPPKRTAASPKPALSIPYLGPVDWRRMVEWLAADGVISLGLMGGAVRQEKDE